MTGSWRHPAISFLSNTLSLKRTASYDRSQDPRGLTILHSPECLPSADIVFIHGPGGSSRATWCKNRDLDLFWPSKWLPLDVQLRTTRISSFGYDAPVMSRDKGKMNGIFHFGKDLLVQLQRLHEDNRGQAPVGKVYMSRSSQWKLCIERLIGQCPIIFVVHSMGGLVFKQVSKHSAAIASTLQACLTNDVGLPAWQKRPEDQAHHRLDPCGDISLHTASRHSPG